MFDILMYLFENYMGSTIAFQIDYDTMIMELEEAGFHRQEINRALDWLDGLSRVQKTVEAGPTLSTQSIRHYLPEECEHINKEARGFMLYLEQTGILDPATREIVIDRLMALDPREIDSGRVKWVVLIALFNQPDKQSSLSLLQEMVLTDALDVLH